MTPLPIGTCLTPAEIAAHRAWRLDATRNFGLRQVQIAVTCESWLPDHAVGWVVFPVPKDKA